VMCGSSWVRNEQNMCCTELCPYQGSDFCMNLFWDREKMTEILKATRKTMQI